jgi:hypothetical protein
MVRRCVAISFLLAIAVSTRLALAACGPGKVATYSDIEAVWYERTNCFGTCPGYQVAFGKDGDCYYVGYKYVSMLGRFAQTCTLGVLKRAVRVLRSHDFYHLNYDSSILVLDAPHYIVAAERCGVTTKLDWPAFQNRKDIKSMFDSLDVITKSVRWHKISNSTESMDQWLQLP